MTITITDDFGKVLSSDALVIPADLAASRALSDEGFARIIARQVNAWQLLGDAIQRIGAETGVTIAAGIMSVPTVDGGELHFGVPMGDAAPIISSRHRLLTAARQIVAETGLIFDVTGDIKLPTADGSDLYIPALLAEVAI